MFNHGNNLRQAVLGLTAAAAVFLGSAPMAAVAQERCEARFDFAPSADVSGRVEWRIVRGGLVDIQVEAAPGLGLAVRGARAVALATNSAGQRTGVICSFDFGAPGQDDICEARRYNRGDLLNQDITLFVQSIGSQTMPCLPN